MPEFSVPGREGWGLLRADIGRARAGAKKMRRHGAKFEIESRLFGTSKFASEYEVRLLKNVNVALT